MKFEIGQTVVISSRYRTILRQIDRITKTQVIIGKERFKITNGWEVGASGFGMSSIYPATEEDIKKINLAMLREKTETRLSKFKLDNLTELQLNSINELLDSFIPVEVKA